METGVRVRADPAHVVCVAAAYVNKKGHIFLVGKAMMMDGFGDFINEIDKFKSEVIGNSDNEIKQMIVVDVGKTLEDMGYKVIPIETELT